MRFGSRGPSEFATEMPWRSHTFAIEKKISSPRERPKWKWVLVFTKKALYLTCVRSQTSREIRNATISEFSTSLKSSKSREQFLLRLTFFLPYLQLTVKVFQFLRLSTKFLAVLRLSVNPIKTFFSGCLSFYRSHLPGSSHPPSPLSFLYSILSSFLLNVLPLLPPFPFFIFLVLASFTCN